MELGLADLYVWVGLGFFIFDLDDDGVVNVHETAFGAHHVLFPALTGRALPAPLRTDQTQPFPFVLAIVLTLLSVFRVNKRADPPLSLPYDVPTEANLNLILRTCNLAPSHSMWHH